MSFLKFNFFDFLGKKKDDAVYELIAHKLLDELAFKELALYTGISYIANTISKCKFEVYEKGKKVEPGEGSPNNQHILYKLNVAPNQNECSSQFFNKLIEKYFYDGAALVIKENNNLYIADGFVLDDTDPIYGYKFTNIRIGDRDIGKVYKPGDDYLYFKLGNKDVKRLIDSIYEEYGAVLSTALSAYKRTNSAKFKLLLKRHKTGNDNSNKIYNEYINNSLKPFINGDGNSVLPLYTEDYDLEESSNKSPQTSADFISVRKDLFEIAGQALKIPQAMMTGNITNLNDVVNEFLTFCIDPITDMLQEVINQGLFSYEEWKSGCYVKIDTSKIKHIDVLEMADKIYNLIGSGFSNRDETRVLAGLEPINDEWSKTFFVSKNFIPINELENVLGNEGTPKGGG